MTFKTYALSDIGKIRKKNEDAYLESSLKDLGNNAMIMVVADGMGGHKAGDVASNQVIEVFKKNLDNGNFGSLEKLLENSIIESNKTILDIADAKEHMKGMGTTCTAMILANGKSIIAHVGDSRAYLVRKNSIRQLTQDHTVAEHMVSYGMMSEIEAKSSPKKNILMRALGTSSELQVDIIPPINIQNEDIFILCTDGLVEYLGQEEILEIATSGDPEEACKKMVSIANERGGRDNITVVISKAFKNSKFGFLSSIKKRILN